MILELQYTPAGSTVTSEKSFTLWIDPYYTDASNTKWDTVGYTDEGFSTGEINNYQTFTLKSSNTTVAEQVLADLFENTGGGRTEKEKTTGGEGERKEKGDEAARTSKEKRNEREMKKEQENNGENGTGLLL